MTEEDENGVHRESDQEIHGSAVGSSSGSTLYGTPVASSAGIYTSVPQQGTYTISGPSMVVTAGNTVLVLPPEPPPPPKQEGIKIGEIVAHRCWPIRNGFLWGTASGRCWAPGEIMEADPHHLSDGLGVYSFKDMSRCLQEFWDDQKRRLYTSDDFDNFYGIAFGTVFIWGEVVEHEIGYRSQYGVVRSIEFVRGVGPKLWYPELTDDLRKLYRVKGE